MVKLGPDVYTGTDSYSGYQPTGNVTGFSMLHESGTGGAPKYGVVSQFPIPGSVPNPLLNASYASPRATGDEASVGYYKSVLTSGVTVELGATEHAGLFQYAFPTGQAANIIVDVSQVLQSYRGLGWSQGYAGGNISAYPDGHYEGNGTYNNGWNSAPDWTIYFCGRFSTPPQSQAFSGSNTTIYQYGGSSASSSSNRVGMVFTFNQTSITSRVGVSFISSAKACQHIDDEIPASTSLQTLTSAAVDKWNSQVLSKVTTTETNTTTLQLLYTAIYGMYIIPSNKTGENPSWTSSEPYYDDIVTFWDTSRCHTALMQLLQPTAYEEFIRSLIDIWRHEGYLPDARSSNYNGKTQGGSNADDVLADAYVKGVRGAINWADGYSAMLKDATVQPPNNNDPLAPDSSTKEGRGALPDWLKYGYITPTYTRAVSRAVEYAVNDFSVSQVAAGLGNVADASLYLNRSRNWRNHWSPGATAFNVSGFVVPRFSNGSFAAQDPLSCGGCYWPDAYYQGTPWLYSLYAPHDTATLVSYSGGAAAFQARLDATFNNNLFDESNEPGFNIPYLYNFINAQDSTVNRTRSIGLMSYGPGGSTAGLPGNSDAGALQSYLVWNMIGLYPITGTTTFLIGSPWLPSLSIDLGGGKTFTVSQTGGDLETNFYVQSLKVNGKSWNQNWLSFSDVFAEGGTMEFVLGAQPVGWDRAGAVPPSPASTVKSSSYAAVQKGAVKRARVAAGGLQESDESAASRLRETSSRLRETSSRLRARGRRRRSAGAGAEPVRGTRSKGIRFQG
ncbi:MAG: hypothetical protein M1819_005223 [Sarea resinae]|nr:MAG: hypothetical protein M1819_005223 [Sarea resinae]